MKHIATVSKQRACPAKASTLDILEQRVDITTAMVALAVAIRSLFKPS